MSYRDFIVVKNKKNNKKNTHHVKTNTYRSLHSEPKKHFEHMWSAKYEQLETVIFVSIPYTS